MYKRVSKHVRKQVKEQELGINDEQREVLGLHDTDDSESDSSNSDDSGSDDEPSGSRGTALKRKRGAPDAPSENEDSEAAISDGEEEEDGISAEDALSNPVFDLPVPPGAQSCAICPGKTMKNSSVAKDHVTSAAHMRRQKRFIDATHALQKQGIDLGTLSASDVVTAMDAKQDFSQPSGVDSAKSRRKRKRDRGGKKRREERERQLAAGGLSMPSTPVISTKPSPDEASHRTHKPKPIKSSEQLSKKRVPRRRSLTSTVRVTES